jgi:hypothetical protein
MLQPQTSTEPWECPCKQLKFITTLYTSPAITAFISCHLPWLLCANQLATLTRHERSHQCLVGIALTERGRGEGQAGLRSMAAAAVVEGVEHAPPL